MSAIYILIPIAVVFTVIGLFIFFWAVKTEQFDDLEKQGMSVLFDEDDHQPTNDAKAELPTEQKQNTHSS